MQFRAVRTEESFVRAEEKAKRSRMLIEMQAEQYNMITEKIASMSCKAAVKGNNKMSTQEANALIDQLLSLENPYNCPHGRPTIISMSHYELDKKFKRIV